MWCEPVTQIIFLPAYINEVQMTRGIAPPTPVDPPLYNPPKKYNPVDIIPLPWKSPPDNAILHVSNGQILNLQPFSRGHCVTYYFKKA